MATRGGVWSDKEVAALLAVWSEDSIQRQLLGAAEHYSIQGDRQGA